MNLLQTRNIHFVSSGVILWIHDYFLILLFMPFKIPQEKSTDQKSFIMR